MTLHLPIIHPGFGSAAKYIAASTKEVIRDAEGLTYKKNMITIMEIMGRNARAGLQAPLHFPSQKTVKDQTLFIFRRFPLTLRNSSQKVKDLLKKNPPLSLLYPKESSWLTDDMSASLEA